MDMHETTIRLYGQMAFPYIISKDILASFCCRGSRASRSLDINLLTQPEIDWLIDWQKTDK